MFLWRNQNKWREAQLPRKKTEKLEFDAWLDIRNFRIWRMHFRSGVSSCGGRPIKAMMWINDPQSAKSIGDLKASRSITWVKLHSRRICTKRKTLSGRHVAWMTHEYFNVSDTDESVCAFIEFLKVELNHDNIQSFNTRWDRPIVGMITFPPETCAVSFFVWANIQRLQLQFWRRSNCFSCI